MEDKSLNNYINHLNKVKRNSIVFQDVSHLLIFMRLIIEKENIKDYPNISFFSNWYLHSRLDRNTFAKERLKSIYELMCSKFSIIDGVVTFNNDEDFFTKISEVIGVNAFKQEIIRFNTDFSVFSNFNDIKYSDRFLKLYLTGISYRPLMFLNNSLELIGDISIKGFQFIEVEDKIHFEILTNQSNNPFVFTFVSEIN